MEEEVTAWLQEGMADLVVHLVNLLINRTESMLPVDAQDRSEWGMVINLSLLDFNFIVSGRSGGNINLNADICNEFVIH